MERDEKKRGSIEVQDIYFGKVGHSIKNPVAKWLIDIIWSDRVRKKEYVFKFFALSFADSEVPWYTNFMNEFFSKQKVKCYFNKNNDTFIIYPVIGNSHPETFIEIPKKANTYVQSRKEVWEKVKGWKLDPLSVKKEEAGGMFSLEFKGEYEKDGKTSMVLEHTVFKGMKKVVLQAFVSKGADPRAIADIKKVAQSIKLL
ncbi:MAG: hypothetical protein ABI430_03585 [Candidatus Taylorbacteria bacterium]